MDKLEPLIRNRFWILAGLILPLAMYGFYSANGQLKAATKARVDALTTTKNGVSSGMEPNKDYIDKLQVINGFLEGSVDDAIVDIWRHQQARMTWPPLVADKIPKDFLGAFDQQVPFIYKSAYEEIFQKLQERIQPVRPIDPMTVNRPNANKVVQPNQKVVLAANLPQAIFPQFGLSSEQMWDAQIDVWMTTLLLDAIVKMNQDKESVTESVIRRIDILQLVGGSGEPKTSDSASPGGDMMGGMGGEMMGGGPSTAGPKISTEIRFDPAQEFGPATDGAGGGDGDMMSAMMDAGPGGATAAPPKRYIGDIEANPFLERGFYMSVIIQQNKIPDFISELVNSDWPIQVRRFQVGVNPYRTALANNTDMMPGMMNDFSMSDPAMSFGGGGSFESSPSFASPPSGGGFGMGDFGGGMGQNATLRPNIYATNLPPFAAAAMNHPDLVRLDLCGVITMYKQPTEVMAALEARKAAAASAAAEAAANAAPVEPAPAPAEAATPGDAAATTPESANNVPTDDPAASPAPPAPNEPAPGAPPQ